MKNRGDVQDEIGSIGRKVLVSAAIIGVALKLAALYGVFILVGGIILMFIVFVVAFGLLFGGKLGEYIGAFQLARVVAKIAVFLNSWTDPIINFIIRKEFEYLGIVTI